MKQPRLCFCFCKLGLPKERPCLWFCFGKAGETSLLKKREKSRERGAFAAFAIRFCQRHCVSLCKGKKLKNSAKPNSGTVCRFPVLPTPCAKAPEFCKAEFWESLPVLALELGTLFPNSAQAEFGSFGSRLLVRKGYLGAKAPLDPLCLAILFCNRRSD